MMKGFEESRGGDVPKVVIVVTDGQSQDEVAEAAQLLRDAHVTIFAVGVTNLVNVHQLHQVSPEEHDCSQPKSKQKLSRCRRA